MTFWRTPGVEVLKAVGLEKSKIGNTVFKSVFNQHIFRNIKLTILLAGMIFFSRELGHRSF